MSLEPNQIVDNKYRIVRLIGEGGMGAVYEGQNTLIRRRVAIKVLHADAAQNEDIVRRFEREAQVAGQVGNDHLLEILDLGALPGGDRYMVMEYLDGEELSERIKALNQLTPAQAAFVVKQILDGLAAAHNAGIVHRDIKPENIFLLREKAGSTDYVKIIDFGISKFKETPDSLRMTKTGTLMGTPHYMSPEQASGSSETDNRSDLYAVGIILYECITGRIPYESQSFNKLLFEIALAELPHPRTFIPDLDDGICSIIARATARAPEARFQSAEEFGRALDAWLASGSAVSIPPPQTLAEVVQSTVPRASALPTMPQAVYTGPGAEQPASAAASGTVNSWASTPSPTADDIPRAGPGGAVYVAIGALVLLVGGGAAFFLFGSAGAEEAKPAAVTTASTGAGVAVTVPAVEPEPASEEPVTAVEPVRDPAEPEDGEKDTEPDQATSDPGAPSVAPVQPTQGGRTGPSITRSGASPAKTGTSKAKSDEQPAPAPAPAPEPRPAPMPGTPGGVDFGY